MADIIHYTCPHCSRGVSSAEVATGMATDNHWRGSTEGAFHTRSVVCPNCGKHRITLVRKQGVNGDTLQVWPVGTTRAPVPTEVPESFRDDYGEAARVLALSPKASAALGRCCLQRLLREELKVKHGNLADEIQEVLDRKNLPTMIAESVDAVRNIGNFASHPIKSTSTGQIVQVEDHEAEWTLDVLDMLFDFVFVQPAKAKAKRDALNAKLADAKKPPMK